MAGLRKQTKLNIEDTNVALLGSEFDKKARLEAAQTEAAWKAAGKAVGIEVWRIEQFKVVPWPKEKYGHFHSGDSYIVLKTYKKDPNAAALSWNVHFWLGTYTTQDEAGTAAYKTVELDDFLGGAPVQYREVQSYESRHFISLFPSLTILDGGVETGFKHVKPEEYRPRLLHIKGKFKNVQVFEVPLERASLNSGDVFILDAGLKIFQFNGAKSGPGERSKGAATSRALDDERKGLATVTVVDDGDQSEKEFWEKLGGFGPIKTAEKGGNDDNLTTGRKALFRLSDASGTLTFTEVAKGSAIKRSLLDSSDAFIFDTGFEVFAWVGKNASKEEKKKAIFQAQEYLIKNKLPVNVPIARILEGGENEIFEAAFN